MREIRPSGSEGGARFYPSFLPLAQRLDVLDGHRLPIVSGRFEACFSYLLGFPGDFRPGSIMLTGADLIGEVAEQI